MEFRPGQHLHLGVAGSMDMREYSIYSGIHDDYIEVLIKEIEGGLVSRQLRKLEPGANLAVEGPFGFFVIDDEFGSAGHCFVATGTGIAPFRCISRSFSKLSFHILHGIRYFSERYDFDEYDQDRYHPCVSRDHVSSNGANSGAYGGRVTDYLTNAGIDSELRYFLCGNCDMIYEVFGLLRSHDIPADQIATEVYF